MARARNYANWTNRNSYLVIPFLAFFIPLIVRAVPEILMGAYPVGFDTIAYYVPNTINWLKDGVPFTSLLSSAPVIYLMLMGITATGAPIVVTLKVLGPMILGLLGLTIYLYAYKALSWSRKKSLLVALLGTLYFVSLRMSWDMFRSEIAAIMLFAALIFLAKNKLSLRNSILLSLIALFVVLTHQLITVILFATIIVTLASLYLKGNKIEFRKLLICLIPAAITFISIIYITYFVFSEPIIGASITTSSGLSSVAPASSLGSLVDSLGFFVFCFLPLIPLLAIGAVYLKNLQFKAWLAWTAIPIVLAIAIPTALLGGVYPYRWIMLLIYPFSFYAIEGLSRIKWKWPKIAVALTVALIVCVLSAGFIAEPNSSAFEYFGTYTSYVPKSMLQNTLPASDCPGAVDALAWAQTNMPSDGRLLVHEAFYGWSALYFNSSQLLPYGFLNPQDVAQQYHKENPSNPLLLIWWVNGTGWYGQPNTPSVFREVYHSGNIAVYAYSGNLSSTSLT